MPALVAYGHSGLPTVDAAATAAADYLGVLKDFIWLTRIRPLIDRARSAPLGLTV